MDLRNLILFFLSSAVIFTACQKEVEQENIQAAATGNLAKTASGDCSPIVLGGTYIQNMVLGSPNYMEVQVNFTTAGDYMVKSDTVNGFSFKATGQATAAGVQTIRLAATGTPLLPGTNRFTISFSNSTCVADIIVSTANAQYSFGNTAGVCTATISGAYTTGVVLGASHTVALQVNVTSPGSFSITSNTVNGMTFSYSGAFTATGTQTVTLAGSGTPAAAGSFTFNSAPSGGCTFVIPVTTPAATLPQLTTTAVSSIVCTSAISGGNITSDGGAPVTARGICYGTTANPTITANTVVNSGSGIGSFTSSMTGLTAGTTYHVRAFATNSVGTAYGNNISFTTTTGCTISIFVTGWHDVFNISGNIRTPKLWVNTTGAFNGTSLPFTLNAGTVEANSVFVSGNDVYIAGTENGAATLWKNGVKTNLTPVQSASYGAEVYVSGTDVYVAGTQSNMATLWKNGVATTLTRPGSFTTRAEGLFVSGPDVYVTGYSLENVSGNPVYRAVVWKNGVGTALTSGPDMGNAHSVFVSGSDVYVVGKDGNSAMLWKNGVATTLSVSPGNTAVANGVFVSGTDVYIVGTEDDGNSINSFAKLWKNGTGSYLTTSGYRNQALGIFVLGVEVFVAGSKSTGGANTYAGVWRNGFFTATDGGSTDAMAYSVFVK